jgi:MFS family permease
MVAIFFLGTFFLQEVAGHGPLTTGLLFLPVAAATMVGAQSAGRTIARLGVRSLAVTGLLVAAAGLLLAGIVEGTPGVVLGVSVASIGLGMLFVVASATALGSVEPHQAGVASGLLSSFHEVGASLGAAVMSGVAAVGVTSGSASGFRQGYVVAALVAVASAGVAAILLTNRDTTDHPEPEGEQDPDHGMGRNSGHDRGRNSGHDRGRNSGHDTAATSTRRRILAFLRHYLEMVVAMLVGMALFPIWSVATRNAAPGSWVQWAEVDALVMATAMSIPMVVWMVRRGHRWGLTVEMVLAMGLGFVVLFPLLWGGAIDGEGLMMAGHVLMPVFMLGAMLVRRREYLAHC